MSGPARQERSTRPTSAPRTRRRNWPPKKGQSSHPSYKEHRGADNAHGVITAQTITGGAVSEYTQLMALVEQPQSHTQCALQTVVADSQYGTIKNFLAYHDRGLIAHMVDLNAALREGGQRRFFWTGPIPLRSVE